MSAMKIIKRGIFQSTLPARGATEPMISLFGAFVFQSTLPARGATSFVAFRQRLPCNFNPRSPHGERQEATSGAPAAGDFNPRSPHGERPTDGDAQAPPRKISIHAPRTGSDNSALGNVSIHAQFQSTLPARGATNRRSSTPNQSNFNPRSPHGERHICDSAVKSADPHFNPRSPHGERPIAPQAPGAFRRFQSTLPARGATRCFSVGAAALSHFNPRSPHGERHKSNRPFRVRRNFNPRSPHGERLKMTFAAVCLVLFQSTLPARGATTERRFASCT